ncbi:hypothetical protein RUM44_000763 [Polyplax serrata]|uniref:Uncharacterized protein n=1 Tax=Polyplax serrata TaxID=468196 RepID=A0ABR1B8J1_POLSC
MTFFAVGGWGAYLYFAIPLRRTPFLLVLEKWCSLYVDNLFAYKYLGRFSEKSETKRLSKENIKVSNWVVGSYLAVEDFLLPHRVRFIHSVRCDQRLAFGEGWVSS